METTANITHTSLGALVPGDSCRVKFNFKLYPSSSRPQFSMRGTLAVMQVILQHTKIYDIN